MVAFPDKSETLKTQSLTGKYGTPFMLVNKPTQHPSGGKRLSNGYWINVHFSIQQLVGVIGKVLSYYGVGLYDVEITYAPSESGPLYERSNNRVRPPRTPEKPTTTLFDFFREQCLVFLRLDDNFGDSPLETYALRVQFSMFCRWLLERHPDMREKPINSAEWLEDLACFCVYDNKYPKINDIIASVEKKIAVVFDVLTADYATGFRFEPTYVNLLKDKTGFEIDEELQTLLKQLMFRRGNDLYCPFDAVADADTRKDIIEYADALLEEYGCFEFKELYALYEGGINARCIGDADEFERFYESIIGNRNIRCVAVPAPYNGHRIARYSNGNALSAFEAIARKMLAAAADSEYGGVIGESDMHRKFCAFSTDLLAKIAKNSSNGELILTEINGITCYQTLDSLGLPDNFSETLAETLSRLDNLGLPPSEEVLHTALSLSLGMNIKAEYNIPDQATYRRLVAAHYKAEPPREWKQGVFGETRN
jgi:hypothetical protein